MANFDKDKTVVVATGNAHKVVEIEAILSSLMPEMTFVALGQIGDFEDPVEDGETFTENAAIKAKAAIEATGFIMSVADDSGICVDALGGAPGIYSARYAGEHGNDKANNDKLLAELEKVGAHSAEERLAHFHSSIVLLKREGSSITQIVGEGDCPGKIGFEPKGEHGFGYDPLFLPDETPGKTMAELSAEEKNAISHRFYALKDLASKL